VVEELAWTPDAVPLPKSGRRPLMVVPVTVGGKWGGSKLHEATVAAVQIETEANAIPKVIGIVFMWLNRFWMSE
jgi:hypothetical protein